MKNLLLLTSFVTTPVMAAETLNCALFDTSTPGYMRHLEGSVRVDEKEDWRENLKFETYEFSSYLSADNKKTVIFIDNNSKPFIHTSIPFDEVNETQITINEFITFSCQKHQ